MQFYATRVHSLQNFLPSTKKVCTAKKTVCFHLGNLNAPHSARQTCKVVLLYFYIRAGIFKPLWRPGIDAKQRKFID